MKQISPAVRKLNVGCGLDLKKDFLNIDILPPYDMKVDLSRKPYPFNDDSFDYIYMDNVLEHIKDPILCLEELHRICSPKGTIKIIVPFYNSPNAYRDMTHCNFFNLDSFNDFDIENKERRYEISKIRFKVGKKLHPSPLGKWIPGPLLNIVALSFGNIAAAITFELQPVKDANPSRL